MGDLSRHDSQPGRSEVGSKFPLQFIVGLIELLDPIGVGTSCKAAGLRPHE